MVAGISLSIWFSKFEIWVAILLPNFSFRIEQVEQRHRDTLGSPFAILAHPDQGGPVPGTEHGKKEEPSELESPIWQDKPIEIGQTVGVTVADSLDAIKGDAAHLRQPGDGGGFHVDKTGLVGAGKASLLSLIGDLGAGHNPLL